MRVPIEYLNCCDLSHFPDHFQDKPRTGSFLKIIITAVCLAGFCAKGYNQSANSFSAAFTRVGVYSKKFVNPLCVKANQAVLASIQSLSVAVYGERRFLLSELNFYAMALCLPVHRGAIGLSIDYSGYKDYNETQVGLGYGKSLGKIDIGVRFNLYSLRITGYGSDAVFNIEAGAIFHLSERLYAGLHAFNPTRSSLGNNPGEKLPSAFSAGIGYEFSELVMVQAEIVKEEKKPLNIHAGMKYHFAGKLFFSLGMYGETANWYFGIGIKRKGIRFDITSSYHSRLGFTPGLLLVFQKTGKE